MADIHSIETQIEDLKNKAESSEGEEKQKYLDEAKKLEDEKAKVTGAVDSAAEMKDKAKDMLGGFKL